MTPIQLLTQWIEEEKAVGASLAQHAVLASQGLNGAPHGRVVAIKEINEDRILFFTQQITRKVAEIKNNNKVSLTFWLERYAREVIVEGQAHFLSESENNEYWQNYPQWAQVRFCSYAPTSGLVIENKNILEEKRLAMDKLSNNDPLPCSPDYCGIAIKPACFIFYSYRLDELSDVWKYQRQDNDFVKQILSP
ncbi:MAG: pyridoxamine 5'-phosphate oxidase family protein [Proteobacteria bacterium]|nr:pyridoxamine 5'-phosphate oxidase family protein [Pseudomonadota bacterium]